MEHLAMSLVARHEPDLIQNIGPLPRSTLDLTQDLKNQFYNCPLSSSTSSASPHLRQISELRTGISPLSHTLTSESTSCQSSPDIQIRRLYNEDVKMEPLRPKKPKKTYLDDQITCMQTLPDQLMAHIIGRQGKGLKQIREASQAQIEVDQNLEANGFRTIKITGKPRQVAEAMLAIGRRATRRRISPKKEDLIAKEEPPKHSKPFPQKKPHHSVPKTENDDWTPITLPSRPTLSHPKSSETRAPRAPPVPRIEDTPMDTDPSPPSNDFMDIDIPDSTPMDVDTLKLKTLNLRTEINHALAKIKNSDSIQATEIRNKINLAIKKIKTWETMVKKLELSPQDQKTLENPNYSELSKPQDSLRTTRSKEKDNPTVIHLSSLELVSLDT